MKKMILLVVVLGVVCSIASAQEKTAVNDPAAARMLLGRHMLSLQWVSWDYFGVANVTNRGGVYSIKGEQKGRGDSSVGLREDRRHDHIDRCKGVRV